MWEESHPGVPVNNGYYAVVLGAAQPLPASVFNGQPLHLGVSLVGQSELTPRLPVVSVPYALKAGDSAKLEGLDAASFARAGHSHASVPFADRAGDSDKLGGVAASSCSLTNHSHSTATTLASGFMSSSDKVKLDALPSSIGAGLTATGSPSTLAVDFVPAGGVNGSATAAARADHSHATPTLNCAYRRASTAGGTPAVSYCAANEELSGGSCAEYDTTSGQVLSGGEPTAITFVASAPQGDGGPGFRCAASATNGMRATAMCCRVMP